MWIDNIQAHTWIDNIPTYTKLGGNMMYVFIVVFILCFIVMIFDEDTKDYGHHDSRPDSYYQISNRKERSQ